MERLKDMDLDGVWGQLCFPNYARFAGHRFFLNVKDPELGLACLRTYNDYLLAEWCATDPNRLYGAAILPLQDINLYEEPSEVLELNPAAALESLMDHFERMLAGGWTGDEEA